MGTNSTQITWTLVNTVAGFIAEDAPLVWIFALYKKKKRGIIIHRCTNIFKLFNWRMLLRIRKALEPKLRCNQNEFRPGRTTVAQILALRCIMEEAMKNSLSAALTLVDFRRAFDSISRQGKTCRF